jgi:hypothetical protein
LPTLLLTDDDGLVGPDELGIAEPAFRRSTRGSIKSQAGAASFISKL